MDASSPGKMPPPPVLWGDPLEEEKQSHFVGTEETQLTCCYTVLSQRDGFSLAHTHLSEASPDNGVQRSHKLTAAG